MKPSLNDWAWFMSMVSQAYVGLVSANFKEISLVADWSDWMLAVILYEENELDLEEISYADSLIDPYLCDVAPKLTEAASTNLKTEVHLEFPKALEGLDCQVFFRRREE